MITRIKSAYRNADDYLLGKMVSVQTGFYSRAARASSRAKAKGFISIELVVILSAVVVVTLALWRTMGQRIVKSLQKIMQYIV